MAFTVVQVTDTHLGRSRPQYVENWQIAADAIAALRPDLVINTGDLSKDGADSDDDLAFARSHMDALGLPWLAIPGNHDVGDDPVSAQTSDPPQEIAPQRLARYRQVFGDDWWCRDVAGWRLIGLNTQLCNSDMAAETEQATFLDQAVASANGKPIALFLHKPLFAKGPAVVDSPHRFLNPPMRQRLEEVIRSDGVRLVASGHLHLTRHVEKDGADCIWAPSTAFVLGNAIQPTMGRKEVGFVEYRFDGDTVSHRFHHPAGMTRHTVPSTRGNGGA